jgi:hypothetical protein
MLHLEAQSSNNQNLPVTPLIFLDAKNTGETYGIVDTNSAVSTGSLYLLEQL